ncbi:hypothetical protein Glove_87g23 [Diversispora epigaea]|uniref:Ion transport domain-containing protein n=1 Tax=Diversispora epigaea TaxID=1348612 RepID=A0A397JAQ8_9GLOM|nr:hypothetical protein Glove_87g23 [Diversispora epigaea]
MSISDKSGKSKLSKFDDSLDESDIKSIVREVLQVDEAKVKIGSLDSLIEYIIGKNERDNDNLNKISIESGIETTGINPIIYNESRVNHKNDELIQRLIDYCREKYEMKEYRFMLVVSNLLPELVKNSYKNIVDEFSKRSNYVEVPLEFCEKKKFISIREELWGYRFPNYNEKLPSSIFDRFERIPRRHVTLCHVPLPGLCTFPKDDISFFSCGLSPFIKLVLSSVSAAEVFQDEHASSKIYESQYFQAIVKYKWHTFARKPKKDAAIVEYSKEVVNSAINSYTAAMNTTINNIDDTYDVTKAAEIKSDIETIYQTIFYKAFDEATIKRSVVAINDAAITAIKDVTAINAVMINNTYVEAITAEISRISDTIKITEDTIVKKLMIVCTIQTVMSIFVLSRNVIILSKNRDCRRRLLRVPSTYLIIITYILVILTEILELFRFKFPSSRFLQLAIITRTFSVFLSCMVLVGCLVFFKNIGIFIIAMIVFAIAHSLLILFSSISTNFDDETKAFEENKFGKYSNSLDNTWTGFLNAGYDGLSSWGTIFPVLLKITFSFFTAIIIMNLLIAFVNDIYNNINRRKDAEWTAVRAQVIAHIEILCSSPNKDFPGTIFLQPLFMKLPVKRLKSSKRKLQDQDGRSRSSSKSSEETAGSGGSGGSGRVEVD